MSPGNSTRSGAPSDVVAAVVWAGANILFIEYVGQWLVFSGGLAVMLAACVLLTAVARRDHQRRVVARLLLMLTLVNFNAWAFSHIANLMAYLGLFFFPLFGLIMGAALYRLLSMIRLVSKALLLASGALAVLLSWYGGLALEASYFPKDAYQGCITNPLLVRLPPGVTNEQLKVEIPRQAQVHLGRYASGLTLGYVLWVLRDGSLDITVPELYRPVNYRRRQQRVGFGIRLGISLLLVIYGVFSQIRWLDKTEEQVAAIKLAKAEAREQKEEMENVEPENVETTTNPVPHP